MALELGLTTEATNQQFVADMERAAADERYHATLWPLLVSAWKRKNDK